MAFAFSAQAQTTVTSFAPTTNMLPKVWYENDVRTGGVASIVDLTGVGGDLENFQPLEIGAAKITTDNTTAAKAEVGVGDDYGAPADIFDTLAAQYSWYKENVGAPAPAPSLKLAFFNPVCDDPASAGDCFGSLVYEVYQQAGGNPPTTDTWAIETIDKDNGLFWWTGGFGQPNGGGGCPCRTLAEWLALFSSDFSDSSLVRVSIGVGSNNPGQVGCFDDVSISHAFGDGYNEAYDFEPAPPANTAECKDGGWSTFNKPKFRNQGDCVSFVATGGKPRHNK